MRGSHRKPVPEADAVAALCAHWKVEVAPDIDALTDAFLRDTGLGVVYREAISFRIRQPVASYRVGQTSLTAAARDIVSSINGLVGHLNTT